MNFKLLPSENFTICTTDSISIARQKLMEHVENPKMIRSIENRDFRGMVSEHIFKIYPIHKSNFNAPIIIGKFETIQNETLIHLQITLRSYQYFLLGANSFLLLFAFIMLIGSYLHYESMPILLQILYLVNMFFCSSIIGLNARFYLFEVRLAKAKLKQIFLSRL
jgi:hypothetical protein